MIEKDVASVDSNPCQFRRLIPQHRLGKLVIAQSALGIPQTYAYQPSLGQQHPQLLFAQGLCSCNCSSEEAQALARISQFGLCVAQPAVERRGQ